MAPRRWALALIWVCTCVVLQLHCVAAEERCVFPFKYGNKKHFDCIKDNSLYHWCSLTPIYSGKWKYCTVDDRRQCEFPFNYKGQTFNECTRKDSIILKYWCSLTRNYHEDQAWKYCY